MLCFPFCFLFSFPFCFLFCLICCFLFGFPFCFLFSLLFSLFLSLSIQLFLCFLFGFFSGGLIFSSLFCFGLFFCCLEGPLLGFSVLLLLQVLGKRLVVIQNGARSGLRLLLRSTLLLLTLSRLRHTGLVSLHLRLLGPFKVLLLFEGLFFCEFVLEQLLLLGLPLLAFLRLLLPERLLLFTAQKSLLLGLLLQGKLLLLLGSQLLLQFVHLRRCLPHLLLLLTLSTLSFFLHSQQILGVLLRTFSVQLL